MGSTKIFLEIFGDNFSTGKANNQSPLIPTRLSRFEIKEMYGKSTPVERLSSRDEFDVTIGGGLASSAETELLLANPESKSNTFDTRQIFDKRNSSAHLIQVCSSYSILQPAACLHNCWSSF